MKPKKNVVNITAEKYMRIIQSIYLQTEHVQRFIIDFEHVERIDSKGIKMLFLADKLSKSKGAKLSLQNASHGFDRLFKLVRLYDIIDIVCDNYCCDDKLICIGNSNMTNKYARCAEYNNCIYFSRRMNECSAQAQVFG